LENKTCETFITSWVACIYF